MASDTRKASERSVGRDVLEFAREHDIEEHLAKLIARAEEVFGEDRFVEVEIGEDAEIEDMRFITIRFDTTGFTGDELHKAYRRWDEELARCPIPAWNLFHLDFSSRV